MFSDEISTFSHERIRLLKVKCKCGHTLSFISNGKVICNHCGRMVYANKKKEFNEKLMKEIKKNEKGDTRRESVEIFKRCREHNKS